MSRIFFNIDPRRLVDALRTGVDGGFTIEADCDFTGLFTIRGPLGRMSVAANDLTTDRAIEFPDASGVLALTTDIRAADGSAGAVQYSDGSGQFNSNAGAFDYDSSDGLYVEADIEIADGAGTNTKGLILTNATGTRYRITVGALGVLTSTEI